MTPLSGKTRAEVWLNAVRVLHDSKSRLYNLILEVNEPELTTSASRAIEKLVDAFLRDHNCQPLHTVAETIFPAAEYRQGGLAAVYAYPETVFPFIKAANPWGTYALRMNTPRVDKKGQLINPLEALIEKLRHQLSLTSTKRAVYELSLMSETLDLTTYEVESDHTDVIGGQCLSHLSFKLGPNRELYLTGLYRYQWFMQKALGNLLGLARLQSCVARELNIPVGPLVCHATLGILEGPGVMKTPWKTREITNLIADCERVRDSVTPEEAAA